MHARGRPQQISPITLTTTPVGRTAHARLSLKLVQQSNRVEPRETSFTERSYMHQESDPLVYMLPAQPAASSCRLGHSPPCSSLSHSSTASTSPEPTPAPQTPPELVDGSYPPHFQHLNSLDYYDSPPSPPRTLQDQMQVAYANDDIHLAKILLLKLKGIEVRGDNDPRIAEVRDEDFNSAFVPCGGLKLDEEDERRCIEGQRREQERQKRRARQIRLLECERIWEKSAEYYREGRARAIRKREEEARGRRRAEIEARGREREAREREKEKDLIRHRRTLRATCTSRAVLSYGALPASNLRVQMSTSQSPPKDRDDGLAFEYPLMPPVPSSRFMPQKKARSRQSSPNRAFRDLAALNNTNVSFADVMTSIHGPLFPVEDSGKRPRRRTVQMDLLDALLNPTPWDMTLSETADDSRVDKIKRKTGVSDGCIACSVESYIPSTPSTSASKLSKSWFSFGSRSFKSSASTTLTSPSSSPMSPRKATRTRTTSSSSATGGALVPSTRHSCNRSRLVSALTVCSDDPLDGCSSGSYTSTSTKRNPSADTALTSRGRPLTRKGGAFIKQTASSDASSEGIVRRLSRSVSTFIDAAAQFHRAYVKATMYSAGPELYFSDSYSYSSARSRSRSRTRSSTVERRCKTSTLKPQGYRVCSEDVLVFTSSLPSTPLPERAFIPLSYTSPSSCASEVPRVFPAPRPIPRSPFRLPYPPSTLTSRLRPVANPLLLRLRALQNVCGSAKEVKEKVVGVAWEGIGRSGLVREIKPGPFP